MQFDWSIRTLKEWRGYLARTQNTNWMQSWAYAQATFATEYFRTRMALVIHNNQPVAMMSVQEIKFGPLHFVNLKRGPLWFEKPTEELFLDFAKTFRKEFPKSLGQRLRWMPEFELAKETLSELQNIGFKLHQHTFTTSWINLELSEADLRKNLQQKWRNCLNKSLRSTLEINVETSNKNFSMFMNYFKKHVREKKYQAPSERFLKAEFNELSYQADNYFIWAFIEGVPVAAIAIVTQGATACYRLGWTTDEGRKYNAHYALIWKALLVAKEKNLTAFDVGGLLLDESLGFNRFKVGLGGSISNLVTLR
ncbi:MAG: peptidoglycan bridge formation glycyltransferase FemA/FemB family protein [Bdellovibrionota bacterium]